MTELTALTPIQFEEYSSNVKIFEHTLAIEVPDRLDAIADSFKTFNNESMNTMKEYMNTNMNTIFEYIGTTVYDDVEAMKTRIENEVDTFTSDMQSNISGYVNSNGIAYSVQQVNSLIFSGNTSYSMSNGDITEFTDGAVRTYDILYDNNKFISAFKEKITIDGIEYVKEFTIDNSGDMPIVSEVLGL
jgi:hypothetical protein